MARGRSIDLKLPPTRSLTRQREFRARKAARMAQLEEDNAALTAENAALKAHIERLERQVMPPTELDVQLRQSLLLAREELDRALARLDAGPDRPHKRPRPEISTNINTHNERSDVAGPSNYFSQPPSSSSTSYSALPPVAAPDPRAEARRSLTPSVVSHTSHSSVTATFYPDHSMAPPFTRPASVPMSPLQSTGPGLPPFDPNCCGGLFDCSGMATIPESSMRFNTHHPDPAMNAPVAPPMVPRSASLTTPSLRLEVPTRAGSFSGSSYDGTQIATPTTVIPGTNLPAYGSSATPSYGVASPVVPVKSAEKESEECCWGIVECELPNNKPQ